MFGFVLGGCLHDVLRAPSELLIGKIGVTGDEGPRETFHEHSAGRNCMIYVERRETRGGSRDCLNQPSRELR